jgi:hypothetical protein
MDELARLRESITRHAVDGLTRTALPGVSILRSSTTTEPLGDVVEPTPGADRRAAAGNGRRRRTGSACRDRGQRRVARAAGRDRPAGRVARRTR